jgi:hypothetical protein
MRSRDQRVRVNRSRQDLGSGSGEIVSVSQLFGSRLKRFTSFACGQRLAEVRLDVSGLVKKVDEVGSGEVGGVRGVKGGRLHGLRSSGVVFGAGEGVVGYACIYSRHLHPSPAVLSHPSTNQRSLRHDTQPHLAGRHVGETR